MTKIARPLPVEFLLIDIPLAFPKEPIYRFKDHLPNVKTQFPVENRSLIGEIQVNVDKIIKLNILFNLNILGFPSPT